MVSDILERCVLLALVLGPMQGCLVSFDGYEKRPTPVDVPVDSGLVDTGIATDAVVLDAAEELGQPDVTCSPCDPIRQCGCPQGLACDRFTGPAQCREVQAMGTEADLCTEPEQCAPGYTCASLLGEDFSCFKWCNSDSDCSGGSRLCALAATGGTLCGSSCSPVDGAGCPATLNCYLSYSTARELSFTVCVSSGIGEQGDLCERPDDCSQGHHCLPSGECARYCEVATGKGCEGTQATCQQMVPKAVVDGIEYGVCQ